MNFGNRWQNFRRTRLPPPCLCKTYERCFCRIITNCTKVKIINFNQYPKCYSECRGLFTPSVPETIWKSFEWYSSAVLIYLYWIVRNVRITFVYYGNLKKNQSHMKFTRHVLWIDKMCRICHSDFMDNCLMRLYFVLRLGVLYCSYRLTIYAYWCFCPMLCIATLYCACR